MAVHCTTCRCSPDAHRCRCGHLDVHHDLSRNRRTRTACAWTTTADGTPAPCPCTAYTPQEAGT